MAATKTLTFSLTAAVTTLFNGATRNIIDPDVAEDIVIDQDPGYNMVICAAGATAVSIMPPNAAEGDEIIIIPEFQDQAGSLARNLDLNVTVTGPTTDDIKFATLTGIKVPASMIALTVDNNDANNSVNLKVLHFRRSA